VISSVAAKDADTCFELRFADAEGRAVRSRQLVAWASAGAFRPVRGFPLAEGPAVADAISSLTQAR
jgi:hypothetical protein